jgi:3-oxoadipate enol-lactonase
VGDGPALVLMHGAEANRAMFSALVPLLAGRFTVITYDQRDSGDTESPERAATLAELADDAHALILARGFPRAHVFGSSFGGRVAQAFAILHPTAVDRLILGSTWPLPHALSTLSPESAARMDELRRRLPGSAQELARLFFPEPSSRSFAMCSPWFGPRPSARGAAPKPWPPASLSRPQRSPRPRCCSRAIWTASSRRA